jgi:integrase
MAKKARDGLFRRGGVWWIRTDPIERKAKTTGCRDLAAARGYRAERERLAKDPTYAAAQAENLQAACNRLSETRAGLGKSSEYHETKLGHWLRLFGDDAALARVGSPEGFDEYVRQRRTEEASDHTITKEVSVMLTVLRMAKRVGRYTGDLEVLRPFDLSAGYVPRTRALTAAELGALLGELAPERGAFVALCVGLGVRKGEAFGLLPEHVDVEAGLVHVAGTKTAGARRTLPILPPFRGLVAAAAAHLPLKPWSRGNYLRDLKAACTRAKIDPCTPNDLRRTHATLLRNAGVDRDVVRGLLGHTAESVMLEAVYDAPKPHELAARAGELVTMTRQLEEAIGEKLSGRAGFRTPDIRLVRPNQNEHDEESRALTTPSEDGQGQSEAADVTETRHSAAAHALALAAEGVLNRRVFMVPGVRYRGKAARRA